MKWTDWLIHNEMMQPQHPYVLILLEHMRLVLRYRDRSEWYEYNL